MAKKTKIRKKPRRSKATEILSKLAHMYYDDRCFVTHEKFRITGFTLHHLWYIENDVIWKHYKNRDKYYEDLEPLVHDNPKRFILVKNGVHTRIDHPRNGLSRLKRVNFIRLVLAVLLTRK